MNRVTTMISAGLLGAAITAAAMGGPSFLWGIAGLLFVGVVILSKSSPSELPAPVALDLLETSEPPPESVPSDETSFLLATMSHEIRTPLNGVIGMVEILLGTELSLEQRRIARTVYDSGQVLSQVVDDYLAHYRMESGEPVVSNSPCNLEATVLQVAILFQGLAYDKGLDLVVRCAPDVPVLVESDSRRLSQILANLVLNAIKYTQAGEVKVALEREGSTVAILVSDTGVGIEAAEMEGLFTPFRRLESSVGTAGTGIGLSISKRLTEALGGRLSVESEAGVGTTFRAEFELRVLAQSGQKPELTVSNALVAGRDRGSLLSLAEYLESFGLQTQIVDSVDDADVEEADLAFVFGDTIGERVALLAEGRGIPLVNVLWLSEPEAHDPQTSHVLIRPFASHTVRKALVDVSSGAKRTSTLDLWRGSVSDRHPLSIVIGEDDPVSSAVLVEMFKTLGYQVNTATTGPATLQLIEETCPDVAFIDLNMPGFGCLSVVERASVDCWWIAISASGGIRERHACREVGVREFLTKPISMDVLRGVLFRASEGRFHSQDPPETQTAIEELRDLFADSPEAYADLITTQVAQTDLLINDILNGLALVHADSPGQLAAHTLRSSAAMLGCDQVADLAGELELNWTTWSIDEREATAKRLKSEWLERERAFLLAELSSLSG